MGQPTPPIYTCPKCKTKIPFGTADNPPPSNCPTCYRKLVIPTWDPDGPWIIIGNLQNHSIETLTAGWASSNARRRPLVLAASVAGIIFGIIVGNLIAMLIPAPIILVAVAASFWIVVYRPDWHIRFWRAVFRRTLFRRRSVSN